MQITINLADIFCDGEEPCDLQEAIKAEVVRNITAMMSKNIHQQISHNVTRIMDEEIASAVKVHIPAIIDDILNVQYTPVDTYGSRGQQTTFRTELLKKIQSEMQYKPQQYESNENVFTKAIRNITKEQLAIAKTAFDKQVNAEFIAQVHAYAVAALAKKLGLDTKS